MKIHWNRQNSLAKSFLELQNHECFYLAFLNFQIFFWHRNKFVRYQVCYRPDGRPYQKKVNPHLGRDYAQDFMDMLKAPMPESMMADVWMEHFQYIQQDLRAKEGIYGSNVEEEKNAAYIFFHILVFVSVERLPVRLRMLPVQRTSSTPNSLHYNAFSTATDSLFHPFQVKSQNQAKTNHQPKRSPRPRTSRSIHVMSTTIWYMDGTLFP